MAGDWCTQEIDLIVADYFAMLEDELADTPFNKAERNRNLREVIDRSKGSIEFKHQNISAVLLGLGQPWVNGYKPAPNFQNALVDGVLRWLDRRSDWLAPPNNLRRTSSAPVFDDDMDMLWIGPPPTQRNEPPAIDPAFMAAIGKKYDVAARDERNRALGKAGEERVLVHERSILREAGRPDLAERVRWTAVDDGDGYGFDIQSFEPNGRDRLLEVKTTNGWDRTPFHITRNELKVAEDRSEDWHLVRLYDFAREAKAFILRPPLEKHAELTATSFLASLH